jgi:hypothetical protein
MNTAKRLLLGISLGASLGAALAGLLLRTPLIQQNLADISLILEWVFGRFYAEHIYTVIAGAGAIIGTIIGGSLAISKRWGIIVLNLFVGIAIGGAAIHFIEAKVVNWASAAWEQTAASQQASAYLQALRAMDQAATNQMAITKFQTAGRDVLSNYLHETESREQIWKGREPGDFMFTNSGTYHIAQKYLATHPDVVQTTNLPNLQTNSPPP